MTPLEVDISVDFVVKAKGHLPLKEKLLEDVILGAIRAAKESFAESTWLSWRQGHCPPPFGAQRRRRGGTSRRPSGFTISHLTPSLLTHHPSAANTK